MVITSVESRSVQRHRNAEQIAELDGEKHGWLTDTPQARKLAQALAHLI